MPRKRLKSQDLDAVLLDALGKVDLPLSHIAKAAGIPMAVLSRFVSRNRPHLRTDTASKLLRFLDLEVRRK
jgi:hypothetical protein